MARLSPRTSRVTASSQRHAVLVAPTEQPRKLSQKATRGTAPREGQDDQLSSYFRQLADHDLLDAEQERLLAERISRHEHDTWLALLGVADFVEPVIALAQAKLAADQAANQAIDSKKLLKQAHTMLATRTAYNDAKQAKKLALLAAPVAQALRAHDLDREIIDAVVRECAQWVAAARAGDTQRIARTHLAKAGTAFDTALRAHRASADARNAFVRANLRLVVTMARRYDRGQMALPDLIQEGNLGLMHSVGRFDPKRGLRFSTYACWWIRHAIGRALADKARAVRIPVHMLEAQQQLEKVRREQTRLLGRPPSPTELAKAARLPIAKLDQMHQYMMGQAISLDKPLAGDDERTFGDTMATPESEEASPADDMTHAALGAQVKSMLAHLSPMEADVLTKRFGIGDDEERTFREIGDEYELSRERIRQIQNSALDKLKRALTREHRGHVEL